MPPGSDEVPRRATIARAGAAACWHAPSVMVGLAAAPTVIVFWEWRANPHPWRGHRPATLMQVRGKISDADHYLENHAAARRTSRLSLRIDPSKRMGANRRR